MTVGDLKAALENYDEDMPVCIGMIQSFGSNFATELDDIDEFTVDDWEYGEEKKVVLTQGSQIGDRGLWDPDKAAWTGQWPDQRTMPAD